MDVCICTYTHTHTHTHTNIHRLEKQLKEAAVSNADSHKTEVLHVYLNTHTTLNCRQAPAAITRKGYDALPARCDCIRSRVGPEHNIMFVIYSLGVTLAGNS